MKHRVAIGTVCAAILVFSTGTDLRGYLEFGVGIANGRTVALRWMRLPVRYFVTDRGAQGVSAMQLQTAIDRAFRTWEDVPSSAITYQFVGFTRAEPGDDDGIVTLGFQNRPELEGVLGSTDFVIDTFTGAIVEADILLNSSFPWSVSAPGEPGRFDVQSIALHEIGHLSGLGHSLLGETELTGGRRRVIAAESVMFPIAYSAGAIEGRTLRADDLAGISDLYPDGGIESRTGSISGRVTKNGRGVFGAHVVAFNARTGALVGGFTASTDGEFVIAGVDPGPTVLRAEPLDDASVDSFFDEPPPVDTAFRVTYFDRLTIVPRGGGAGPVEIQVRPQ